MKRCLECGREYDNSMMFCLDDGAELLYGPAAPLVPEEGRPEAGVVREEEPATAVFGARPSGSFPDAKTRLFEGRETNQDQQSAVRDPQSVTSTEREAQNGFDRRLLAALLFIVIILFGGFFSYRYFASNSKQIQSIAVMPFVNDSGNSDVEYLSDGMTETLIRTLSQLPNLNVKSRSSVFRYKGRESEAKTIGSELGVQAILNGHVIQRGNQLSLSLELIDPQTENVIWTDRYDRASSDLVSLQNEIASDVSDKLKMKLSGVDQQKVAKSYTSDPEAYRLYLQGRYFWNKRSKSEVDKAIPFFKQAVERDPNFALGYVGLADSDEDRDRPLKKDYIRRALAIDDGLAEAHASLGYQYMLDYDWTASERELKRAMELDPKYARSYAWNGARLMMIGKYDEALASIDRALDLDPTSIGINFYKGVCLGAAGRQDEAIRQLKKLIEMDPTFPWAHSHLSRIYKLSGDYNASVEERAISLELDGQPDMAKGVRDSYAKGGWDALQRYMAKHNPPESFYWGIVTEQNKEEWIAKLQKQAEAGNFWLFLIKTDPSFDVLRDDARFQELVRKFNPPQ